MLLKRLLVLVLAALAFVAAAVGVDQADRTERLRLNQAGTSTGTPFSIPVRPALTDPTKVLDALEVAADRNHVNVLRTSWGYDAQEQPISTIYLYQSASQASLFENFRLSQGRSLTAEETRSDAAFMATGGSETAEQVGVIADIWHNDALFVRPLAAAFASLPAAGQYQVECGQPEECKNFLQDLAGNFKQFDPQFTTKLLTDTTTLVRGQRSAADGLWTWGLIWAVVISVGILAAFRQLYEAKRTAVLSLHGYSWVRSWFVVSGRLSLLTMLIAGVLAIGAAALVPGVTAAAVVAVAANVAGTAALAVVATLVSAIYIRGLSPVQALKNRKDTRLLAGLSLGLKFVIASVLIVLGVNLIGQYQVMSAAAAKLGSWAATSQYGVFVPKSVGHDLVEAQTGGLASTSAEVHQLYPRLNEEGALYVDASEYETAALAQEQGGRRSMTVNANYLAAYPILDADGLPVKVSDDTTDWILLVPAAMHDQAAEITAEFQASRSGTEETESASVLEKRLFGRTAPPEIRDQRVRIIWIEDGQGVFAFDPEVAPDAGNRVSDPIISVITSANSLGVDRLNGVSGAAGSAIKVKLDNGDTAATLSRLQPTLRELQLDDNLNHLVTLNDYALADLQLAQQSVSDAAVALALALFLFCLVALQTATVLFEQNSRRIVVRRLHGYSFGRRHAEFLLFWVLAWFGQAAVTVAALVVADGRWGLPQPAPSLLLVVGVFAGVELLIAGGTLSLAERRRVPAILKGDF